MNHGKDYCLVYNPIHPYPRSFLGTNNTVEEAGFDNTTHWIQVIWTNNRFYVDDIPIPREYDSEDSSKGKTNTNDSNDEANFPNAIQIQTALPTCALSRVGGEKAVLTLHVLTVDPCKTMQQVLDE